MDEKINNQEEQKSQTQPFKDYNVAERTFVLKIFFSFFAPFMMLGVAFYYFEVLPWYFAPIASAFFTCLVLLFFKLLFKVFDYATGHVSTRGIREQLSAEIDMIKYHKRIKNYDEAMKIVENVLEKDPDFPDALYLKGQILFEGYGFEIQAKDVLLRVMMLVSREEPLYHWASNYRKQITEAIDKKPSY